MAARSRGRGRLARPRRRGRGVLTFPQVRGCARGAGWHPVAGVPDVSLQRREVIDRAACARGVADAFRAASAPLRRLVAFDAAIWLATDPATSLPVAPTRAENLDAFRRRGACVRLWDLEFGLADVNLYAQPARSPTPAARLRA